MYCGILSITASSPSHDHPIFYCILFHHFRDRYFYLGYLLALMMTTERTSHCSVCFNTSPKVKLLRQHYFTDKEYKYRKIWVTFQKHLESLELLTFRLLINGTGSLSNFIVFDIVALNYMPKEVVWEVRMWLSRGRNQDLPSYESTE